jgi:hypothetical protein
MTDYVNMIWQAIQEQARTALAALEAHSRYYMVVYPEQVITRIRDSALEDAQVPRALRDLLYDIARPPAHEKDADLCPWQTSEALHAFASAGDKSYSGRSTRGGGARSGHGIP